MQPDPKVDCSRAAIVTLAGRDYFVPVLALRQTRVVVPTLLRLMPAMQKLQTGGALSEAIYDDMLTTIHTALTRAYPGVSVNDLLDLPVSMVEMIAAVRAIAVQTGIFEPAPGEAAGEPSPPISTAPSAAIANGAAKPGPML